MKLRSLLKKLALVALSNVQAVGVAAGRLTGAYDYPVPPISGLRKTSSRSIRHYYVSGIRTAVPIMTCALAERIRLHDDIKILDFGCGVGRQLLHFTRHYPDPSYFACDIDETSVAFVAKSYPEVEAYANTFNPPLRWNDGFFDMVYSVSIFSHLARDHQTAWLAELGRVVKPGGYCFLTTEGFSAVSSLARVFDLDETQLASELLQAGLMYKEYQHLAESIQAQNTLKSTSLLVGVEGTYGNTLVSPDYIRTHWEGDHFEVVNVVEGVIDFRQDLVVLRRRSS